MRNLKRALSLTLASVMLLGMMVVGAGAAGYKDVTDDHNVEAIEVLQAVGAMVGDEAGNFDPDANVNRAQIATIMSRLLDLKVEDFNAADIPFTDVPEWAVPFVAACYADGITSGISATAFGSSNDVTAVQAALMMMKALGYFQYQEDFEQDWQLATLKKASEIGLFYGVTVDRTSPLTRNDVAQMALNALKSNMVSFTGSVGSTYPVNGETVRVGYKPEYTAQTSADAIYNRIDVGTTNIAEDDRYYVQLGEYLYGGDLRLTSDIDVFGRPARHWEFEGADIGTYVKEELLRQEYTSGVTGKTVFDLLGRSMIQDSELFVYVDGDEKDTALNTANEIDKNDLVRSNADPLDHTGRGVLTQVFVDTQNMEITIAIINTYLAQATTAYSEKNETISLRVYNSPTGDVVKSVPLADVPEIEGLANGDWMLVYLSNMDTANSVYRVVEVMDVEIIADVEIDEFSTQYADKNDKNHNTENDKDDSVKTIIVGEDTYNKAEKQSYDQSVLKQYNDSALVDATYNIYLDLYGNFIGVDLSEGTKNYVFIAGYDMNPSNITNRTAKALAIFPDGTKNNIDVNVKATNTNINNMTIDKNDHDDRYADVYCEWRADSYGNINGFTYGAKNNPLLDDNGDPINYDGNVENLWYTYRVTDKGVYTLTPVAHFTIDGWDGTDNNTTRNTIRTDSVSLWHQNDYTGTAFNDSWGERSYGNTDSVYIVGSNDDNDFNNQVVGTVDGVYTSVDKVNISYQEPDYSVSPYNPLTAGWANAVVDGDGYVIAAVILGEAEGAVDNYAYILKGAYAERYDRVTGTTYHKFDVYMNGEVKTLTAKDTYEDTVPNIKVNHVQQLVLDADGMVTRVRDIPNAGCGVMQPSDPPIYPHWDSSLMKAYGHNVACLGENAKYKTGGEDNVYDHMEAVAGIRITNYSVYYMDTDKVLNSTNGSKDNLDLYFKGDTLYMKDYLADPETGDLDKAGLFVAKDAPALLISADGSKTEFAAAKDAYSNIVDADTSRDGLQFNGHVAAALDSTGKAVWVVFYDESKLEGIRDEYYDRINADIKFLDESMDDGQFVICPYDQYAGIDRLGRLGFEFYLRDKSFPTHARALSSGGYTGLNVEFSVYNNGRLVDNGVIRGIFNRNSEKHPNEWYFRANAIGTFDVNKNDKITVRISDVVLTNDNEPVEPTQDIMWVNVTYTDKADNTELAQKWEKFTKTDVEDGFVKVTADLEEAGLTDYKPVGASSKMVPFMAGTSKDVDFKVEAKSQEDLDKEAVEAIAKKGPTIKSQEEAQDYANEMTSASGIDLGDHDLKVTRELKDGKNVITVTGTFNATGANWITKLEYNNGGVGVDEDWYLICLELGIPEGATKIGFKRSDNIGGGERVLDKEKVTPMLIAVQKDKTVTLTTTYYRTVKDAEGKDTDVVMGVIEYIIIDKTVSETKVEVPAVPQDDGSLLADVTDKNAAYAAGKENRPMTITVETDKTDSTVRTKLSSDVVDALKANDNKVDVVVDIPDMASVQVPVEALSKAGAGSDVSIVVDPVTPVDTEIEKLPGNADVALSFDVTLEDGNGKELPIKDLSKGNEIKLTFPIPAEYRDADNIALYYYDTTAKKYVLVESEIVGGNIVASVDHLTEFTVVDVKPVLAEVFFVADATKAAEEAGKLNEKYGVGGPSSDGYSPNTIFFVVQGLKGSEFKIELFAEGGKEPVNVTTPSDKRENVITINNENGTKLVAISFDNKNHVNQDLIKNGIDGNWTVEISTGSENVFTNVAATKTFEVETDAGEEPGGPNDGDDAESPEAPDKGDGAEEGKEEEKPEGETDENVNQGEDGKTDSEGGEV